MLEIECPTYKNLNIEVLVIDASTSITYSVLFSCKSLEVKNKEILIVCHDFFDNYLEKIEYYQELISDLQNYIIVLFNFPCQAYTLYTSEITYNNEYLSKCLDLLIYELVRRKLFHIRSDNLRFIGFGYGCNAILHFVSSAFSSINNIKACLLFNCFLYIDDQLKTFLENSIRLLSESEESEFSSLLFDCFGNKNIAWAQNKSEKKSNNPITNQGRIALLKGCLENYNIYKNVQAIENSCLVFVNSSHNSLVSNSQKNIILSQAPNVLKNLKNFYQKGKKFNLNIFDAGYNINNDKPEEIKIIIQDFLKSDIPLDIDQRIAFIDKLLLIVEEIMRKFYREEIENFNNFRDLADSYLSFDFEQFTEIEVDFSETINGLLDIKDRISDLNQKIKKASEFFAENRGEIQEEGDDLIGKIMNIQQKKLNEFSRYLLTIKNEIELPLKNYIFLLKGTFKFLQINEEFNIFKNDNATILETKLGQFAEILLMKQGENDELEKTLIKNIKMFSNFQIRVKKKYNKYLKNLEGLNQANQKFQKFIIIIMNRINPIFQILEEKILKNLEIFLVKYIEGVNFQENIFNCIKLIIDCYDNYYGIKLSNEINLMNMNKKPSSEKNSGGFENEIRQVIEKISKILPEKKSLD